MVSSLSVNPRVFGHDKLDNTRCPQPVGASETEVMRRPSSRYTGVIRRTTSARHIVMNIVRVVSRSA
jgi:hypothetical protein